MVPTPGSHPSRGRRGGLIATACALAVVMLGTTLPTPLYGLYRERFGFSELIITVIFATYAAGVIAALLLFGRLSDQIGRRRVLLPGLALAALSAAAFLLAHGLALLLVGRILSGLSAGIFTGTATATLVDFATPERRGRATLVATIANMGGLGAGPLLAGLLSQWAGWRFGLAFCVDLALIAVASIGVWAMPEPVEPRRHPQLRPQALTVPREMRTTFIDAALAGVAGYAVLGLFTAAAPAFLGQDLGVTSRAVVGLVVFTLFAGSMVGQVMLERVPQSVAMPAGCVALIAGMGVVALGLALSAMAPLVAGSVIAGLGHGLSFRAGLSAVNADAPAAQRGQVASSFFVVMYVAISIPVIGEGVLAQAIGLRAAALVFAAAVAAVAAVALVLLWRDRARVKRPSLALRPIEELR